MHYIVAHESSTASFMASLEECTCTSISERECKLHDEGLNNKVKLALYRMLSKEEGFKSYLHRVAPTCI